VFVHARGRRGILQESPDEGDIREEIVSVAAVGGGGGGPGVLVQEVPYDGDVAGVEQVPDVAADVAVAAAAAGGVVVVIAAQEVSNDGDVVEAEGIVATIAIAVATQETTNDGDILQTEGSAIVVVAVAVAVGGAITAEEIPDDRNVVQVEVPDDGDVVEDALRGGGREGAGREESD